MRGCEQLLRRKEGLKEGEGKVKEFKGGEVGKLIKREQTNLTRGLIL